MDKKTKTCKRYNSYQSIHFLTREEAQVVEAQAALVEVEEWHLRSDKTCSWSQFTGGEDCDYFDYGKDLQTRLEDRKFGFLLRNKTISLNICIDVREVFNAKVIIMTI